MRRAAYSWQLMKGVAKGDVKQCWDGNVVTIMDCLLLFHARCFPVNANENYRRERKENELHSLPCQNDLRAVTVQVVATSGFQMKDFFCQSFYQRESVGLWKLLGVWDA